ncbi:glycosyltransferase family 4 protein [Pseudoalteromonas sp. MMG012]|uniref:glycosyltransferase family 4 protein n=1 Tax=Pseudoalteromonas sp. MMG012 TaxID=2822686 RepID=UPI001B3A77AF|nr:glycosyltransferase family 4 protein [Pseudoalteromonas sp. MMG012]MBQ4849195.1 glycosyltransferase family 4 protein [Pseudoalteromonas sp. MMG012]
MNIWYIHPYAGSPNWGMSFRPYYLSKNFLSFGHNVTVISSLNHHLSSFPKDNEGMYDAEGVPYYLVDTKKYYGNGVGRILNMLGFGKNLFNKKFREFSKQNVPDVIIASTAHPFHFIAANYYAKKFKAKLILEVRDIWPLSLQELVGISKFHPLSLLINVFQKFAYRKCDLCVSLLENSKEYLESQGLNGSKFRYIPNGIEIESNFSDEGAPYDLTRLEQELKRFDYIIGYTGAIGIPNNLEPLIGAAKILEEDNVGVLIIGEGTEKSRLVERAKLDSIDNVVFHSKIPKSAVQTAISLCDAMFINAQPKFLYELGISPNKIFDYMLMNKPVFSGIYSPNNPLQKAGCEVYFEANSALDLATKIKRNKESVNSSIKADVRGFAIKNHSYNKLAEQYMDLFK